MAIRPGVTIAALGALLLSVSCAGAPPPARDVQQSREYLETAVEDAEVAARRAIAFSDANVWNRADKELDSVKLILYNALREREHIRRVYEAAVAVLEEAQEQGEVLAGRGAPGAEAPRVDVTAAADRVERIEAVLSAAERDIRTIEQMIVELDRLDIPDRS